MTTQHHSSSFRDSKNFVYVQDSHVNRQINPQGFADFNLLTNSGLYKELSSQGLLIPHTIESTATDKIIIRPDIIPFVSYPYEWSFSMLKDAALLTIEIMQKSIEKGMILKDASAYNIQFLNGKCIFIDTGSFEKYDENRPWRAYGQFCEQFLSPLLLMSYCDLSLQNLLMTNLDGIPLSLTAKLLPLRAKIRPLIYLHITLHATMQKRHENSANTAKNVVRFSKNKLHSVLLSLKDLINSIKFPKQKTQWQDYYTDNNYTTKAFTAKKRLVKNILQELHPKTVWDMGANQGTFSRLQKNIFYLDFDIDPIAIENNYLQIKDRKETNILPLRYDFSNPPADIGVGNQERLNITMRGCPDAVLFLALLHHLVIVNKIPFYKIAQILAETSPLVLLEFVSPQDSQVQRLVQSRNNEDFDYSETSFIREFSKYFIFEQEHQIPDSKRKLFLLRRRD